MNPTLEIKTTMPSFHLLSPNSSLSKRKSKIHAYNHLHYQHQKSKTLQKYLGKHVETSIRTETNQGNGVFRIPFTTKKLRLGIFLPYIPVSNTHRQAEVIRGLESIKQQIKTHRRYALPTLTTNNPNNCNQCEQRGRHKIEYNCTKNERQRMIDIQIWDLPT